MYFTVGEYIIFMREAVSIYL